MLGAIRHCWWWVIDRVDYLITTVRLAILDRFLGPESPTNADLKREQHVHRLQRAFPDIDSPFSRRQFGKLLSEQPLVQAHLADMMVDLDGALAEQAQSREWS